MFDSTPKRCLIIAEVAQAHDGSLGFAHAFIDAAARAGADAIKFQTHIASAESTRDEMWRIAFSMQDATRYDYWKRMEFTEEQWAGLKTHAEKRGLLFLSSPFSVEAADMLHRLGMQMWKIASGEANNLLLLRRILATRLPILLSTGMSPLREIDAQAARIQDAGVPLTLMQCTSAYPCPPEKIGLNLIPLFRERYGCEVGLSDHSGTIYPGLAAATLGADALEVHITLSRESFGPDVPASLTTTELRSLVDGVRFIEACRMNPVDKDVAATDLEPMRRLFTKSIVFNSDLPGGTTLREEHLTARKPGTGMPIDELPRVLGRRLRHEVKQGSQVKEQDLLPVHSAAESHMEGRAASVPAHRMH